LKQRAPDGPLDSWGAAPLHPNLITFLAEMAAGKEPLMRLVDWTKGKDEEQVGYVGGNAATVLGRIDPAAFEEADIRGASLRHAQLPGARLRDIKAKGADLRDADLMASDFTGGNFHGAKLSRAKLAGLRELCALASDPSGQLLFGGPHSGGWVYDLRVRRFLEVYQDPTGWTCGRAVSDDARWVAHAESGSVRVGHVDSEADVIQWATVQTPPTVSGIAAVAWHPERWFLIVCWDRVVLRVDPRSREAVTELYRLPSPIGGGTGLAVRPPWWIVGGYKNTTVWLERERRVAATISSRTTRAERPEFSADGHRMSIANDNGLSVFDTSRWEKIGHMEGDSAFRPHGWSPTDAHLAFCSGDEVLVVDSGDLSIHSRMKPPMPPRGVAFHGPDELVIVDDDGTIHLYDLKSGELVHSAPQVPLCEGADLRGATGLDDATCKALKDAGARV
jgi:WD40 repeat protein